MFFCSRASWSPNYLTRSHFNFTYYTFTYRPLVFASACCSAALPVVLCILQPSPSAPRPASPSPGSDAPETTCSHAAKSVLHSHRGTHTLKFLHLGSDNLLLFQLLKLFFQIQHLIEAFSSPPLAVFIIHLFTEARNSENHSDKPWQSQPIM